MIQEVGCKGMAKGVGRQWRGNAGLHGVLLDQHPEHHAAHARAALRDEQRIALPAGQQRRPTLDPHLPRRVRA